jgi:hypothetical protein
VTTGRWGAEALLSLAGVPLSSTTPITVLTLSSANATLFTDITGATGGTGPPYNPVYPDARGNVFFFAALGQYQLQVGGTVVATVIVNSPTTVPALHGGSHGNLGGDTITGYLHASTHGIGAADPLVGFAPSSTNFRAKAIATIPVGVSAGGAVVWNTASYDYAFGFTGGGVYTVPAGGTGWWQVKFNVLYTTSAPTNNCQFTMSINGVSSAPGNIGTFNNGIADSYFASDEVALTAGWPVFLSCNVAGTVSGDPRFSYMTLTRLSS